MNEFKAAMTKLTNALKIQDKGKFPFQTPPNPKIQFVLDEETLSWGGKVINKPNKKIEEETTS